MSEKGPKAAVDTLDPVVDESAETVPDVIQPDVIETPEPLTEASKTEEISDTPDAEARFTDAEILGRRYPVRQMVHEIGNQRLKAIESVQAKVANIRDTPQKFRLGISHSIAEARFNRSQRKADEVAHLPNTSRLKKRRLAKLAKAEARKNRAKAALDTHVNRMQGRTESVGKNAERRRTEYIKELRGRRERALARKTMRHELRKQGAGRLEARAIAKEIPKAHMDRVGHLAAVAGLTEKNARRGEKDQGKREKAVDKAELEVGKSLQQAEQYAAEARDANKTVDEIRTKHIPDAREYIASKQSVLDMLNGELSSLESGDMSDPDVQAKIEQTKQRITETQVKIQESEHQLDIYEKRELPYWQSVAEESRRQVIAHTQRHESLQANLRDIKATAASGAETSSSLRATAEQDKAARDAAAHTASNS